jgi:hypothetical protein
MGAAAGLACAGLIGYKVLANCGGKKCPAMKKDGEKESSDSKGDGSKPGASSTAKGLEVSSTAGFNWRYVSRLSDALLAKFSNAKTSMNPMSRKHPIVLVEKGAKGQEQDQRLFMQMLWLKEILPAAGDLNPLILARSDD